MHNESKNLNSVRSTSSLRRWQPCLVRGDLFSTNCVIRRNLMDIAHLMVSLCMSKSGIFMAPDQTPSDFWGALENRSQRRQR